MTFIIKMCNINKKSNLSSGKLGLIPRKQHTLIWDQKVGHIIDRQMKPKKKSDHITSQIKRKNLKVALQIKTDKKNRTIQ